MNMNPEPKFEFDLKVAEKKQTKNENRKKKMGILLLGSNFPSAQRSRTLSHPCGLQSAQLSLPSDTWLAGPDYSLCALVFPCRVEPTCQGLLPAESREASDLVDAQVSQQPQQASIRS